MYPIKSCKGIALERASLDARGLQGDRSFMITKPDGFFMTQRQFPKMAQIQPTLDLSAETLRLEAPGMEALTITIDHKGTPETLINTEVWGDVCASVVQAKEANEWLSTFLHKECRLVTMQQGFKRIVEQEYATSPHDHTGFADGFHILLVSEESLAALNDRLFERGQEPVPMSRFRPNIVVRGCAAFAEDSWSGFRLNGVQMFGVKPCGRCVMTTIDQETGEKTGTEPLATLNIFRKSEDGKKILFGQNVINTEQGFISLGDAIVLPKSEK